MADEEHFQTIRQGVDVWNEWRGKNPEIWHPDLSGANLSGAILSGADLSGANLSYANLGRANLREANLCWANLWTAYLNRADLREAHLVGAILHRADLNRVNLSGANLSGAILFGADLREADLSGADVGLAQLTKTDLRGADLTGSKVYGVSVWDIKVDEHTKQRNLIIKEKSPNPPFSRQPAISVDNIEVAQFIYLLLNNQAIRKVIDTITSKAVLILGRFSEERKPVLDAIRDELRKHSYLPILFDFDVPETRDTTETVSLLARMARFIIADLTDPSSIPKELEAIVPSLAVPVQPLLEGLARPYAMFKDYWKYHWVLPPYHYERVELLLATLAEKVIAPAEAKVKALEEMRRAFEAKLTAPRS